MIGNYFFFTVLKLIHMRSRSFLYFEFLLFSEKRTSKQKSNFQAHCTILSRKKKRKNPLASNLFLFEWLLLVK